VARYCFYCGRELKSGEKCGCRSSTRAAGAQKATSDKSDQPNPARPAKKSLLTRLVDFFNPFRTRSEFPNKTTRYQYKKSTKSRAQSFRLDREKGSFAIKQIIRYVSHPVDTTRQVDLSKGHQAWLFLFIAGLVGGFFIVLGIRQPYLAVLLSLNTATAVSQSLTAVDLFLWVQGFGMTLAGSLLLVLVYHVVLRMVFRLRLTYSLLLKGLSPALFYMALFACAALLLLSYSFFSALLLLVAGFGISTVTQYLAIRRLTSFNENRSFILVALVLFIFSGVMALIFNESLPVLNALLDHSAVI
jgi:hypothetical protein